MGLHTPGPTQVNVVITSSLVDDGSYFGSQYHPLFITGNVALSSGGGGGGGTVSQGTAAATSAPWPVILVSGSDPVGTQTHPTWITGSVFVLNQTAGGAASNVTSVSGSVTGLLLGGVSLGGANPMPVTGAVALSRAVDVASHPPVIQGTPGPISTPWPVVVVSGSDAVGTATHPTWVTGSVFVTNPAGSTVTGASGSVTGLLVGGVALSNANGVPVTDAGGSLTVDGSVSATVLSGSVGGLLVGGVPVSNANGLPVTDGGGSITVDGSVSVSGTPTVTGTVALTRAVDVATHPPAVQGTAAALSAPWPVVVVSGSDVVGTQSHPSWVTGSVFVLNPGGAGSNVTAQSGSVTGLLLGGVAVSNANGLPVTGTVALSRGVDVTTMPAVTQGTAGSLGVPWPVILVSGSDPVGTQTHPTWVTGSVFVLNPAAAGTNVTAQSGSVTGLLLGGVSVSNANGIPVTDAGGSLTVDGAVTVSSGSVSGLLVGGVALSNANGVPVTDAGGSLTVDGSVTTLSGSVAGLLLGGVALSAGNPIPIAGRSDSVFQNQVLRTGSFNILRMIASGSTSMVGALGAGVKIRVLAASMAVSVAATVRFRGTATYLTGPVPLAANASWVLPYNPLGCFETAANEPLQADTSVAQTGIGGGVIVTWIPAT